MAEKGTVEVTFGAKADAMLSGYLRYLSIGLFACVFPVLVILAPIALLGWLAAKACEHFGIALALLVLLCGAASAGSPAESAALAAADLAALPEAIRPQARYLSLYNVPVDHWAQVATAASYMLNAVSRNRLVTQPELIHGQLLRVNLAAYADLKDPHGLQAIHQAWENLALVDPYYHLRTQVADEHGAIQTVTTDGGWVGLDNANKIKALSLSNGAILRADWFVSQLGSPGPYYEFAGVQAKEADFFKALGVDLKTINGLSVDAAANLFRSGVTGKPRRIIYRPGPIGGVWVTKDVAAESPDKDPIRNPVDFATQRFNFDASEIFFARKNKFWGVALFNSAGQRQNAVPPNIATDTVAPAGHQELTVPVSCWRCHEHNGGHAGLHGFGDDQSTLAATSEYPEVANRIAELYDPAVLDTEMQRDREDYAKAVLAATAMTPEGASKCVTSVFASVTYDPVTLASAAMDVGLTPEAAQAAWSASGDPVILKLRQGGKVNRKAWEASFQEAAVGAESWKAQQ